MTVTRLLGIIFLILLLLRVLPAVAPLFGARWRQLGRRMAVVVDVAGGLIMLIIAASLLLRGEILGAALLMLIAIPVFIGTYRALPAWWRGWDTKDPRSGR